jgi:YesN/AraC family two-component response regulator
LGCEARTARNGIEAFEILSKETYTLIITDVQMPRLDGMGLLEAVNKMEVKTPVVIMSGYTDYSEKEIKRRQGLMLLKKPFEMSQLHEVISLYAPDLPPYVRAG